MEAATAAALSAQPPLQFKGMAMTVKRVRKAVFSGGGSPHALSAGDQGDADRR
jgi:hypothetical protein